MSSNGKDVVILGGAGHVGLPLALSFANTGMRVGIFDLDIKALDSIRAGTMPFREPGAPELLAKVLPKLDLTNDPSMLGRTNIVVVVVGTPVEEFLGPSMRVFERLADQIAPHLRHGALVVLRSTVYPGTTSFFGEALRARGAFVDVAFCPERIAEGHAIAELRSLPQVIGADTAAVYARAKELFGPLGVLCLRTSTKEAELAKLFTNVWRYTKFAVANQFLLIADEAGVDYSNVLHAIRTDYPRAADLPSPGFAAGPCLFKDTMQLAAFTSDHFPMGQAAMQINEGMPAYVVRLLEKRHGSLRNVTVGILGMAFKPDSDDIRASLSFKLRTLLEWAGARVLCADPYVNDTRLVPVERVLEESDTIVVATHTFSGLDLTEHDVIDLWNSQV